MSLKIFRCICRRLVPIFELISDVLSKYAGKGSEAHIIIKGNGDFELYVDDENTFRMERTSTAAGSTTTGIYKGANFFGLEDDE